MINNKMIKCYSIYYVLLLCFVGGYIDFISGVRVLLRRIGENKRVFKDFKTGASCWILFTVVIVDARNHEPEI
jgi:hypothetical protein